MSGKYCLCFRGNNGSGNYIFGNRFHDEDVAMKFGIEMLKDLGHLWPDVTKEDIFTFEAPQRTHHSYREVSS